MKTKKVKKLPYRKGVGVLLLNDRGEVFVAQRNDTRAEAWQMPQGGIDKGEDPLKAALRELEEEIGTAKAALLAETQDWITYDLPVELVPRVWKGRYRGQKQKWFAMRFLGTDEDINLETDHPEFKRWRWSPIDELPAMIVPFKRPLYEELLRCFGPVARELARSAE
jgi:putative (di)nucleoside polyphosphate hydrolase